MKAQAEGIVPDTPDKNIVAVKTIKGTCVYTLLTTGMN